MPVLLLLVFGCGQKGADNKKTNQPTITDPVLYGKTVKELNDAVLENNFPPMIASRIYAYANIAAYEVMAAGDNNYNSLAGQIKHLPAMPSADTSNVDFSFASLLAFCQVGEALTFPAGSMQEYVKGLNHWADSIGISAKVREASKQYADVIAKHILAWSKGDNYAQTRSAEKYNVKDEPGRWIPTPPMYAQAVEPHWNEIRTLVLDSASQFMPPRPPAYNFNDKNSVYYKALWEVKRVGDSLTEEQKHIADFWDDNPFKMNVSGHVMFATKKFSPPGHWMNIVGIGAKTAKADFNTTVAAFTETSIALFDAFISCWDEKYRSNYVRPETMINKIKGAEEWRPYIQTPPFPSYTSGHATNSSAAAEVMTEWFGDNLSFTDTSLLEFGIKNREITSFRAAAREAAMSRLYGGIHYRFDNDQGVAAGTKLGAYVASKLKLKK